MKILVANLGSTSFKYRLFDMATSQQLARGGVERIGAELSSCFVELGDQRREMSVPVPDHAVAVQQCLAQLTDPNQGCLSDEREVAAIGFKAVHGGRISGVQRVNEDVLAAMEEMNQIAPAHNPPYIRAMRLLAERFPELPLVAAFETGFHQTIPDAQRYYAIPKDWSDRFAIRKYGFHGASHRYIAGRIAELTERGRGRVISCHLGGSSSLCAIRDGKSVGTTMGMSPQSGLPQNNRAGDFDLYALPVLMERTGKSLDEMLESLASQGGLLGLSGLSGDVRDLEQAAAEGHADARLALDVYVAEIRRYLGGLWLSMGGLDCLVFTGGIGENGRQIRREVCRDLAELGVELDEAKNAEARGEAALHSDASRTQIWVVPTNEELVVARQTYELLKG